MPNSAEKEILLIGARIDGHAGVLVDTLKCLQEYKLVGFIDRTPDLQGKMICGVPVIGSSDDLASFDFSGKYLHIAIGDNAARKKIYQELKSMGARLATIVHPTAIISRDVVTGAGCFIGAGAIVNNGTNIGPVSIINTGSIVEHDNEIGCAVHVAPGTTTAGRVKVEDLAFIGVGSTILPDIIVGQAVMVGAGSTVVKNVPSQTTIIGYAAQKHKKNIYQTTSATVNLADQNEK